MTAGGVALRGLVLKELRHIRHDPRMLVVLIVAPLVQLLIFGYAANLDVASARMVLVDEDHTPASRALVAHFAASPSFELVGAAPDASAAEAALARGEADLALTVPAGFGRALGRGERVALQLAADGADSVAAQISLADASGLVASLGGAPGAVDVRRRVLYNPEFRSRWFLVPGVLALVLLVVMTIATSMAVVREKEMGTFELLAVSPVSRSTLLMGKLLPFAVIGLVDSILVLLVSRLWFGVPLRGSAVLLLAASFPFALCALGLGLLVSTVSRTQQQAMMTSVFLVMFPMIYFSGFVFPVESMPRPVAPLTELDPLRHHLLVLRAVMLRGAGVAVVAAPVAKLAALGGSVFALAVALFRKRVG
ncbi:ABC transporter permease [Anaeromyxobacter terrae]|uniref:ABC transporter permease n=1 Tax=Anaeromyxobacter terrae TaxID=2925406 RepID=UPI001F592B71|nr:ABC transporter permease [Anaeromyxobacter sp. SG22]